MVSYNVYFDKKKCNMCNIMCTSVKNAIYVTIV